MGNEQAIIEILTKLSLPGTVGILSYFVLRPLVLLFTDWARGRMGQMEVLLDKDGNPITMQSLDKKIGLLGTNHFHEVKDGLQDIKMGLGRLEILLKENNDRTLVILTKINGRTNI